MITDANIYELKGSDTFVRGGQFEPNQFGSSIIWDGCGATNDETVGDWTNASSGQIAYQLSTPQGLDNLRIREGLPPQKYNGSAWEDWTWGVGTGDWKHGRPLTRSIDIQCHPDKDNVFIINFTATNMGSIDAGDFSTAEVSVNMVSRPRSVNAWRTEDPNSRLVFPTYGVTGCSGDFGWEGDQYFGCTLDDIDIGGQPVDFQGNPTKVAIEQTYITIEQIVRTPYEDWDNSQVVEDNVYANLLDAQELWVNRRNIDDGLFGYQAGELLCADVTIQPLHNEYKRASMTFIRDEWFHMEQVPWSLGGNKIMTTDDYCGKDADSDDLIWLHADYVMWQQSYLMGFSVCGGENGTWDDYFHAPTNFELAWAKSTGATFDTNFTCQPCSGD